MLASLTNRQVVEELYGALKRKDEEQFLLLFDKMQRDNDYEVDIDDPLSVNDPTLLQYACDLNLTGPAIKLIEAKVNPNKTSCKLGSPPLILAAEKGNPGILSKLINLPNIEVNVKDPLTSMTALHKVVSQMGKIETSQEEMKSYVKCLDVLLSSTSIDVNAQNYDKETALHLASEFGVEEAIVLLLEKESIDLHIIDNRERTVLHKITGVGLANFCSEQETIRYVNCLKILLTWMANNNIDLINAKDKFGFTSLHHTIYFGVEEAEEVLLLNGALIDKETLGLMPPSSLQCFMDSCINVEDSQDEISSMTFSITFDYSILLSNQIAQKPEMKVMINSLNKTVDQAASAEIEVEFSPDVENREDSIYTESDNLLHISRLPKHRHLLKHPLIKSFVMLKWHNMRSFYWFTVLIYSLYLLICSIFILLLHSGWDHIELTVKVLWYCLLFLDVMFFTWELLQCCIIPHLYVRSFENFVDLAMLIFTLIVLLNSGNTKFVRPFSAITILLACIEGLFLLSRHPKLSIYVTMFTKVTVTFLRLFLWFSILLIGFAFSFFLAFETPPKEGEEGKFINIQESLLKFSAMMTGEFEYGNLPFDTNPWTSRLLFVLFVFLIVIVLINLLGGLAITDIQAIQNEAEILNLKRQVESMAILEALLLCDPFRIIPGWTPIRTKFMKSFWLKSTIIGSSEKRNYFIRYIFRSVFLFYKSFPEKKCKIDFRGNLDEQSEESYASCFEFQLEEESLQVARQKAHSNYKKGQKMYRKNNNKKQLAVTKKTENERRVEIVSLLLELRKEMKSEDLTNSSSIHPKMDKLAAEIQDLKVQNLRILELLKN